ncbi:MAG: dicarboxylate/amino acid:cation symporter [Bacteroidota bacterium]|nr:dicarboxylate/amino acid:cation symporter [Bacteroidota bacterium]
MKKFPLHWQILIALILAIIFGILFSTKYQLTKKSFKHLSSEGVAVEVLIDLKQIEGEVYNTRVDYLKKLKAVIGEELTEKYESKLIKHAYFNKAVKGTSWMGDIFLRALKMLIIPLILSSIISAVTNIGSSDRLGRLGFKTMGYYVLTSIFAITTGLVMVNVFQPGVGADLNFTADVEGLMDEPKALGQTLIEIVPDNIFYAFVNNYMLSIIFFALLFGFFITKVSAPATKTLQDFFQAVFDVMMKMTMFIIKFTPFGIFGIVLKVVADQDNLAELAQRMGLYMFVVIVALIIHAFVSLPLLTRYLGKAKPFKHFRNMTTPLLTAFSTSSSGATLPITINSVQRMSGVSTKISKFTLPLGATINMDGTALYECVAAMFIAQAYGMDMTFGNQLIIVITALLASIGAAAIPMAGLVMITVILSAVGLPLEGVGLILAVDRILDMFRTATNVWSDTCGSVIIAHSEGEELPVSIDKKEVG